MVIPLLAILAKKVGSKVAQKAGQKIAQKGAQKAGQKGAESLAKKGLGKFGSFEKSNYQAAQKAGASGQKNDQPIPDFQPKSPFQQAAPPSFHKGGRVRKTGWAKVKKGEVVLTEKEAKKRVSGGKDGIKRKPTKGNREHKKYVVRKRS